MHHDLGEPLNRLKHNLTTHTIALKYYLNIGFGEPDLNRGPLVENTAL